MHGRRASRPLVIGAALVALLGPCLPAGADTRHPTPTEVAAAHARLASARHRVVSLQARAEKAAEDYNGAVLRAQQAVVASQQTAQRATAALAAYQRALATAAQAQARVAVATARAKAAEAARADAQAQAAEAQISIDRVAAGAYQNGGQLGMLSQLLLADDPNELANGRTLLNHVGAYQGDVIATAKAARLRAKRAGVVAQAAEQAAQQAVDSSNATLTAAAEAHTAASAAAADARRTTHQANRAAVAAAAAKTYALHLVAQAQAALGTAAQRAAAIDAAARAARVDANQYRDVDAPSPEARTAIHWAFEEIGVPYSWGGGDENGPTYGFAQGAGTKGFDCSGLTLFAYGKAGIHLAHYTQDQWHVGQRITSRADLLPGDLMFFATDTSNENTIHHVAIYIGKGKMIEAPYTGEVVRVSSADRDDFIGATRPWAA